MNKSLVQIMKLDMIKVLHLIGCFLNRQPERHRVPGERGRGQERGDQRAEADDQGPPQHAQGASSSPSLRINE